MPILRYLVFTTVLLIVATGTNAPNAQARQKKPAVTKKSPPFAIPPRTHIGTIYHAKSELNRLGYWVLKVDTTWDISAKQSLVAFQKLADLPATGRLTRLDDNAMDTAKAPAHRGAAPRHIDVDLNEQVLYVVDSTGAIEHVLPISSGSGQEFKLKHRIRLADTPRGTFTVYKKIEGMHKSPLGMLYYPMFFKGGVAIHGNNSVPSTAESHGCVRIPNYAAAALWNDIPLGTPVVVHGENPPDEKHK